MLTKAIILDRLLDNKYLVRVPVLETPDDKQISKVEATLAHVPGISESYKPNDVVIVGFEEHNPYAPVILGKLFTGNSSNRGYAQVESLDVSKNVNLPNDWKINGKEFKNVSGFFETLEDLTESGGGGGGTVVVKKLDSTSSSALTPTVEDIEGSGTIYVHKVSKTGSYNDLKDKPSIPTVNDASLTIKVNGSTLGTFGANASSPVTVDITVPTNLATVATTGAYSDLTGTPTIPDAVVANPTVTTATLTSIKIGNTAYAVQGGGGSGGVPYTGATDNVNLGNHSLTAKTITAYDDVITSVLTFDDGNYWKDTEIDSNHKLHLKNYNDNDQLTGDLTFPNDVTGTVATSDLLKPTLVGQTLIADGEGSAITNTNNYAEFTIDASDMNGIYVFTYGNCMIPIVAYGLQSGVEYKTSAALVDAGGNYKVKVLTYKYASYYNKIWFYNKENYMPIGWGAALYRIKLY